LLKFGFYFSRFIISFVFAYTLYNKVIAADSFAIEISKYQIIPLNLIYFFTYLMLLAEAIVVITIASGWKIKWGSRLTVFLLLLFITAISTALITGKNFECGCTGLDTSIIAAILGKTLPQALIRDFVLLAITIYIHWYANKYGNRQTAPAGIN
jgi:hypothetical protein